jgi:hypothetical protein
MFYNTVVLGVYDAGERRTKIGKSRDGVLTTELPDEQKERARPKYKRRVFHWPYLSFVQTLCPREQDQVIGTESEHGRDQKGRGLMGRNGPRRNGSDGNLGGVSIL